MAYDEYFAETIDRILLGKGVIYEHKRMFRGLIYMINEKMCFGLDTDKGTGEARLMLRIDPNDYEAMLSRYGAREMDFTGTPMKGFIFVDAEAFDDESELTDWLQLALDFNPKAKKSPKSKKLL